MVSFRNTQMGLRKHNWKYEKLYKIWRGENILENEML